VSPYRRDEAHRADEQPVSGNLFPPILGLVGIGLLACMVWAFGLADRQIDDALTHCGSVSDDHGRLACYDKLSINRQPAKGAVAPIHIQER
jgi:hypothetical protein